MRKYRIVQYGAGQIGSEVVKLAIEKGYNVLGAVDIRNIGENFGKMIGLKKKIKIYHPDELKKLKPDVVIHSTNSFIRYALPQIEHCIKCGADVISTTEELAYPDKKIRNRIDMLSKKFGVTVLAAGVNPGFVMDTLPILMTGIFKRIESIEIKRVINLSSRRTQFQKKIISGFGHIGLRQSAMLIADSLNWKIDIKEIKEKIPGGLKQAVIARSGKRKIILELQAYTDAKPEDVIKINDLKVLTNGIHGDLATVAILVNSIPKVIQSEPGFKVLSDFLPW
jgi:hypothetical protein